jgi:hypothetical protein
LYREIEQKKKIIEMSGQLLWKGVKVESTAIEEMLGELTKILEKKCEKQRKEA